MLSTENNLSKNLISHISPASPVSEAYRTLRTNLYYSSVDKKLRSIMVTSPDMQDGKTVTVCNLAISIASTESKVLLIDADLRKPSVHKQFNLSNKTGLTNLLMDDLDFDDVLYEIEGIKNLKVLTSGVIPPNPAEILASNRFREVFRLLSRSFNIVLIDTPPLCYVSDGMILAGIVDGVILVLSSKQTKINHAQTAMNSLKKVDANILGAVLTRVKTKTNEYYYSE